MPVHPDLVDLVRCPKCRGRLSLRAAEDGFECAACQLLYPICDGIPQLLVDEAKALAAPGASGATGE